MTEFVDKQWNKQYEKLIEFKRKNGNCLVPRRYQEDMSLGGWVSNQRCINVNNSIRPERKDLLDELGFVWKVPPGSSDNHNHTDNKNWHHQYEKLVEFKRKNGNCLVPYKYDEDATLGMWVSRQRQFHSKNKIRLDRKELLDELGFAWKTSQSGNIDKNWHQQYEKLVEFKRKNGHCLVPPGYEDDVSLEIWVRKQRVRLANNKMRQDQKELLDELEFGWNVGDHAWHLQYQRLLAFKRQRDHAWHLQYQRLPAFKRRHGHCLASFMHKEDVSLGIWVTKQQHFHITNKLGLDRNELLDEIGFVRKAPDNDKNDDKKWHTQYEKLVEFKRKNGNCLVPTKYEQDKSLGMWVGKQRHFHSNNSILQDRKDLLDELGFAWKPSGGGNQDKFWRTQYEKLVEFKRKNGHCLVPQGYEKDVSLGVWVRTQRRSHANNKMRPAKMELLDELEFVWNVEDHEWHLQYEKLVALKRQHGHSLAPFMYKEDVSLCNWVSTQGRNHLNNKMRTDREELLDELGIIWKADTVAAARSSTTDVSCRHWIISRFVGQVIFLTLVLFLLNLCRIRIWKRSLAAWVFQAKH
jgi:uncharacterized protein YbgA (DUF1722 family)